MRMRMYGSPEAQQADTINRGRRLLYRIYINWAITLTIILFALVFPKRIHHYARLAAEFADAAAQKSRVYVSLSKEADNYANPAWCQARAKELGRIDATPSPDESPEKLRDPEWCAERARIIEAVAREVAADVKQLNTEAADCRKNARTYALRDLIPVWLAAILLPWIIHFVVLGLIRRRSQAPSPAPPAPSTAG